MGLSRAQMEQFFLDMGEKKFRAQQVLKWIHHAGVTDIEEMSNLGRALRDKLLEVAEVRPPEIASQQDSSDGTRKWAIRVAGGCLELSGPAERPALLRHALQRFAMREAHAALAPWLLKLSAASGLGYERIQIRRQRTRWGSCSSAGAISLNVCLMFQRPEVVSYLLVHELCHRRQMNHSRRFWDLVGSFVPDWRSLDAELLKGWRNVPGWVFP